MKLFPLGWFLVFAFWPTREHGSISSTMRDDDEAQTSVCNRVTSQNLLPNNFIKTRRREDEKIAAIQSIGAEKDSIWSWPARINELFYISRFLVKRPCGITPLINHVFPQWNEDCNDVMCLPRIKRICSPLKKRIFSLWRAVLFFLCASAWFWCRFWFPCKIKMHHKWTLKLMTENQSWTRAAASGSLD